jgi:hypothetical protein
MSSLTRLSLTCTNSKSNCWSESDHCSQTVTVTASNTIDNVPGQDNHNRQHHCGALVLINTKWVIKGHSPYGPESAAAVVAAASTSDSDRGTVQSQSQSQSQSHDCNSSTSSSSTSKTQSQSQLQSQSQSQSQSLKGKSLFQWPRYDHRGRNRRHSYCRKVRQIPTIFEYTFPDHPLTQSHSDYYIQLQCHLDSEYESQNDVAKSSIAASISCCNTIVKTDNESDLSPGPDPDSKFTMVSVTQPKVSTENTTMASTASSSTITTKATPHPVAVLPLRHPRTITSSTAGTDLKMKCFAMCISLLGNTNTEQRLKGRIHTALFATTGPRTAMAGATTAAAAIRLRLNMAAKH